MEQPQVYKHTTSKNINTINISRHHQPHRVQLFCLLVELNIKMHIFLWFSAIFVSVYCAPITDEPQATILSYEYNNDGSGNYNFSYSTSNGISREEKGTLVNKGETDEHIEVRGSYSYSLPDGTLERIEYIADENGFQFSKRIPMPPLVAAALPSGLVASLLGK